MSSRSMPVNPVQAVGEDQSFTNNGDIDRREFLRRAGMGLGAVALPGVLAACGSSASGSSDKSAGTVGGTLNLYTWEGYDLPKELAFWRKQKHVKVKAQYLGVQDDVQAKVKSPAGKGIDVSSVNQSFIGYYKELGILSPITVKEVPGLAKMFPQFQKAPWKNSDGTYNSVPWEWGVLGLTYAPERIPAPKSWDDLFQPKMKGRIAMFDDPHQNLQMAAVALGYNPDKLTHSQLAKAKAWLVRLVKQTKTFTPTTGDQVSLLASGEIDVVYLGWIGIDGLIKSKGAVAKTIVPEGGAIGYTDAAFIPPKADNRATALAWSQQLLSPKVSARASNDLYGAVTIPSAVPFLTPEIKALVPYHDLNSYIGKRVVMPLGYPRGKSQYVTDAEAVKAWEEIKAEAK